MDWVLERLSPKGVLRRYPKEATQSVLPLATENTGSVKLERQQRQASDEVIDRNILVGLAILAQANGHSVVEEMNIALSGYVEDNLPRVLDEDVTASGKSYSYAQS